MVGRLASEQLSWRRDSCRPLSSLSPVPWKPANTIHSTVNTRVHGASAVQQLQTAERDTGYTFVTIDGSLMKRDSKSILKEQDWGKVHLEARPLAIFTCRTCEMGLLTVLPSGLSQSYSKVRHKKHLKQCLVPSTRPTGTG